MSINGDCSSPLGWSKTSSGTYVRPASGTELAFAFAGYGGRGVNSTQNWRVSVGVKITTALNLADKAPTAWKTVRHLYPQTAARLQGKQIEYTPLDMEDVEAWLAETLEIHDTALTARGLHPFASNDSNRAVLHVLPRSGELVIHAPHTHLDMVGAMMMLDRLVKVLVDPLHLSRDEASNLLEPFMLAAEVPRPVSDQTATGLDVTFQNFILAQPTINLNTTDTSIPAKTCKLLDMTFCPPETTAVISKCKANAITVTSALQAAVTLATRMQSGSASKTHAGFSIHDGRKFIDVARYPAQRVCTDALALMAVFAIGDTFLDTARLAQHTYHDVEDSGLLLRAGDLFGYRLIDMFSVGLPPGVPPPANLQLSSLGVVDKYIGIAHCGCDGDVRVEAFWAAGNYLTSDSVIHAWTWGGRLTLQMAYNEAYFGVGDAAAVLRLVRGELVRGLELELTAEVCEQGGEPWLGR